MRHFIKWNSANKITAILYITIMCMGTHHSQNLPFVIFNNVSSHSAFVFVFLFIKLNSTPICTEGEADLKDQPILQPS